MSFMINKILLPVYACLILLFCANKSRAEGPFSQSEPAGPSESELSNGYCDIVFFKGKFIAVGTDGRIDGISTSGETVAVDRSCHVKLNSAFANDDILLAAGERGTILYSADGQRFDRAESGTDKNIYGIASNNGVLLAGSENGLLLGSTDGQFWRVLQTGAQGNIMSLSANDSFFIGITDKGEIIKSCDGFNWDIKDYNKEYAGYNPYSNFIKILATRNSIVIIGTHNDGSPAILFSSMGNVWAEREPFYYDDEDKIRYLSEKPNDIAYDPIRDQFFLACDSGVLFSLPACSKCNEYMKIAENDLYALSYADNCLCFAGDNYSVFVQRF